MDIEDFKMAYKFGISSRKKLTDYSPYDLKAILDKIATYGKHHVEFEDSMKYYDERKLEVVYGCENDEEPIDFILSSATLSWGYYDIWKAEINELGMHVKYRPEHGTEKNVFTIEWHLFNDLKNLFE